MWFSNTTRNLASELNQWLEHLLSQRPPAGERPHLQQQPQLLGSLQRLQRADENAHGDPRQACGDPGAGRVMARAAAHECPESLIILICVR